MPGRLLSELEDVRVEERHTAYRNHHTQYIEFSQLVSENPGGNRDG